MSVMVLEWDLALMVCNYHYKDRQIVEGDIMKFNNGDLIKAEHQKKATDIWEF